MSKWKLLVAPLTVVTLQVQGEPDGGETSSAARSRRVAEDCCPNEAAQRCCGAERQVSRVQEMLSWIIRVMAMAALQRLTGSCRAKFVFTAEISCSMRAPRKKITLQLALHFISFSTLGPALLWLQVHVNLQHVSPSSSGIPWWADEAELESQVEKFNTPRRELCDQVALSFSFSSW